MAPLDGACSLALVNMPGTHDSGACHIAFHHFSRCQNKSVARQLETGARYFDIRIELQDGRLKLVHGIADCRPSWVPFRKLWLEDVLSDCYAFIDAHPSEAVILNFQTDDGKDRPAATDVLFERYIRPDSSRWFLENRVPLLSECRGKLVLFRRTEPGRTVVLTDENSGLNFFDSGTKTRNLRHIHSAVTGEVLGSALFCDDYFVNARRKWGFISDCLENDRAAEKQYLINNLNANNGVWSPKMVARYVHPRILAYPFQKGGAYGIVGFDYITAALAEKIILTNAAYINEE